MPSRSEMLNVTKRVYEQRKQSLKDRSKKEESYLHKRYHSARKHQAAKALIHLRELTGPGGFTIQPGVLEVGKPYNNRYNPKVWIPMNVLVKSLDRTYRKAQAHNRKVQAKLDKRRAVLVNLIWADHNSPSTLRMFRKFVKDCTKD